MKFNKNKGFTIVELITTLLIVGVLMAIAGAAYNAYTIRAKMAEGFVGVDMISKNEIKYYLQHKAFKYMVMEALDDLITIGSIYPSSAADLSPFASGTVVNFDYAAFVGKTNSAGNDIVLTTAQDMFLAPSTTNVAPRRKFVGPGVEMCTNISLVNYVNSTGKPQYSWAFVIASKDFVDATDADCTIIYKLIETNSSGNFIKNPTGVINQGK